MNGGMEYEAGDAQKMEKLISRRGNAYLIP